MSNENKKDKPSEVWRVLSIFGYLIILLSLAGGIYILIEFGTIDIPTVGGSQTNVVGIVSGLALLIQGTITGVVLIAFSTLGMSVSKIELYLLNQDD